MMDEIKLTARKRTVSGKKTRFLRRSGITPTHLFGHGITSQALECDTKQLENTIDSAGMTKMVHLSVEGEKQPKNIFIKEIQKDPLGKNLLHVDFYQVKKGEKIRMEIPIVIVGEAPAMKMKGRMLSHGISSLHVESLPEKIPSEIEVDISGLEDVEQPIHVKDLVLDPGITIDADPEQLIVKVSEALEKEVVEEAAAEEGEAEASSPGIGGSGGDTVKGLGRTGQYYVANVNSDVFHSPECRWAKRIKPENLIVLGNVKDVAAGDYKACGLCNPLGNTLDASPKMDTDRKRAGYG